MFLFYVVAGGLSVCGLLSVSATSDHVVTYVGHNAVISLNVSQAGGEYRVSVEVNNVAEYLFLTFNDNDITRVNSSRTWYRDRYRVRGNITSSVFRLTLYNVTPEDAGIYECWKLDINQRVPSCEQLLIVARKPTSPTITGPVSAVSGGSVTLTCSSSSRSLPPDQPPLTMTYTWRRNSEEIGGGRDVPVDGPNLTVTDISREKEGNYTCQAVEEGLESDWSHGHVLDVQCLLSVSATSDHVVTYVGHNAVISLNVSQAGGEFRVGVDVNKTTEYLFLNLIGTSITRVNSSRTWYRDRYRVRGNITSSVFRLTLYNVTTEDAGIYECRKLDINQRVPGCEQLLIVARKPTPPTITGPASAVSGENFTLTCSSSSRSLPPDHPPLTMTYTWKRNRTVLESGDGSHTGGGDLTITHISRENQEDIYTCQAVEEGLKSDWSRGHVLDVQYPDDGVQVAIISYSATPALLVPAVVLLICLMRRCRRVREKRKLRYAAYLTVLNRESCVSSPYATVYDEDVRLSYSSRRHAVKGTGESNGESCDTCEPHYATCYDEDERSSRSSHGSDATADYETLQSDERFHIYTALYPPLHSNGNRCRVM